MKAEVGVPSSSGASLGVISCVSECTGVNIPGSSLSRAVQAVSTGESSPMVTALEVVKQALQGGACEDGVRTMDVVIQGGTGGRQAGVICMGHGPIKRNGLIR
jgi:hypothetical protein